MGVLTQPADPFLIELLAGGLSLALVVGTRGGV